MGWDAYSSAKQLADFKEKAEYIIHEAGMVDGYLEKGGLDISDCARMLEKATNESCWNENGWSIERVQELNSKANWNFRYAKKDYWAYLSAKEFLSLCAKNHLSVKFSW